MAKKVTTPKKASKFSIKQTAPTIKADTTANEIDSRDLKVTQRPDVVTQEDRQYSIETIDVLEKDEAETLAFFEEPVKVLLHPSSEENAATSFPVWVNGKPAEVFQRNKWDEIGYLPLNKPIVIKRKVLSVIISAKVNQIKTDHPSQSARDDGFVDNRTKTFTKPLNAFSLLEDKNPKGHAWLAEQMNRNM